jgi:hypothetical protein
VGASAVTWTDLATPEISQIRIDHSAARDSTPITTWPLRLTGT